MHRVILIMILAALCSGCGRYKRPLPPEVLAPTAVAAFEVQGRQDGVLLSWKSSEVDRRGKELSSIEGYQIQRKEIANRGDETAVSVTFVDVAFVKDSHAQVREKLRAEARAQGKIGRTVKAPENLTIFNYLDKTARPGKVYIYQVLPQNQGRTDGLVREVARVVFNGADSDISVIPASDISEEPEVTAEVAPTAQ